MDDLSSVIDKATGTNGSGNPNPSGGFDASVIDRAIQSVQQQPVQATAQPVTEVPGRFVSAMAGVGHGVGSTALGVQQLLGKGMQAVSNVIPDSIGGQSVNQAGQWLSEDAKTGIANLDTQNAPYASANPKSNTAGEIGGNIASAAALPLGDIGEGANLINKLIYAAKVGTIVGAAQPVRNDTNYWAQKAEQGIIGAAGGLIGYPVGVGIGKVVGIASNAALNTMKKIVGKSVNVEGASPELQSAVQAAVDKGEKIDPTVLTRQVEADSLPIPMSLTKGQATQDPIQISMERNLRGKNPAMVYKLNDQNSQLIQNIESVKKSVAPDVSVPDNFASGQHLIDSIQQKIDANTTATKAAYKALTDANGGNLPLDGQNFAIQANQALGQNMKGAFLPAQIQSILSKFQTGEQPMTFENFENLRTILAASARSSTDGNVEGAINTVRNTLENMPMEGNAGQLKVLADAARASARQGFNLERQVPAYKSVASGKASPDDFVRKFIINGKSGDIQGMAGVLHDNPEALQSIKASVVNHLQDKSVGQGGNFSQAAYNNAFDALKPKLNLIFAPDEVKTLQTIGNVGRNIQAQPTGSFVNNSNTDVANLARSAGGMVAGAVDAATSSPVGSIAHNVITSAIDKKASAKIIQDTLQTGAGVGKQSATTNMLKNKLPALTGKVTAIPLSAILSNQATGQTK